MQLLRILTTTETAQLPISIKSTLILILMLEITLSLLMVEIGHFLPILLTLFQASPQPLRIKRLG